MNNRIFRLLFPLVLVAAPVACSSLPGIYNPRIRFSGNVDARALERVILDTIDANSKTWSVEDVQPGDIRANYRNRAHQAIVDILYDEQSIECRLVSSANLNQRGGKIHPSYNKLILKFEEQLRKALRELRTGDSREVQEPEAKAEDPPLPGRRSLRPR